MSESRNAGKSVLVRAKTKLEKERWEWLARRRKMPLAQLMREMLAVAWRSEREAQTEQLKAVGE